MRLLCSVEIRLGVGGEESPKVLSCVPSPSTSMRWSPRAGAVARRSKDEGANVPVSTSSYPASEPILGLLGTDGGLLTSYSNGVPDEGSLVGKRLLLLEEDVAADERRA